MCKWLMLTSSFLLVFLAFLHCASEISGYFDLELQARNFSHREAVALADLLRLGAYWKQSRYVNFCDHPTAAQSEALCASKNLKFNATSCSCFSTTSNTRARGKLFSLQLKAVPSVYSADSKISGIDWDAFIDDARKYGLYEAECDLQLGLIIVPQPSDLSYLRYPYAFYGPVCLGYSIGTSCVPSSTTTISQQVYKLYFMPDGTYHSMDSEKIDLKLATSCVEKCTVDSSYCSPSQSFDSSLCSCRCPQSTVICNAGMLWNASSCQCECENSPAACGSGTRFDAKLCLCVSSSGSSKSRSSKSSSSAWPYSSRQIVADSEEDCGSIVVCFNESQSPYFDPLTGVCTCPEDNAILTTPSPDSRCRHVQCDGSEVVSAVPDVDRHGCICPCRKGAQWPFIQLPIKSLCLLLVHFVTRMSSPG